MSNSLLSTTRSRFASTPGMTTNAAYLLVASGAQGNELRFVARNRSLPSTARACPQVEKHALRGHTERVRGFTRHAPSAAGRASALTTVVAGVASNIEGAFT